MAKKSKSSKLLLIVGLGIIAYLLLMRRNGTSSPTQFNNAPPAPPRNKPAEFAAWANTILSLYGNVSELWQPGGPFYQFNKSDILEVVAPDNSLDFTNDTGQWV